MQEERQAGYFSAGGALGTNEMLEMDQNKCKVQMSRVYFSKWYRATYLLLLALCLVGGFSVFLFWSLHWWITCIASVIISLLVADSAWRMGTQSHTFFKEWRSLLDLFFTLILLLFLLVSTLYRLKYSMYLSFGLVTIKVTFLFVTLHRFVKGFHRHEMSIIDLNDMSEVDRNAEDKSGILMLPNDESQNSARQEDDCADFIRDRNEDS